MTPRRTNRLAWLMTLLTLCTFQAACERSAPEPDATTQRAAATPAPKGFDDQGRPQISEADRCAVCGMSVAMFPKFGSAIETQDKKAYHFCNPGCMLRAWTWPERHLGHDHAHLGRAVVPDYFTGEFIDASEARFVSGSDVLGPMGPAPVPLATEEDVKTFKARHGGDRTFRLKELTPATWEALSGKPVAP